MANLSNLFGNSCCNNGCGNISNTGCGNELWLILILLLFSDDGCNNGCGNNISQLLILLILFGGLGNNGCGCD